MKTVDLGMNQGDGETTENMWKGGKRTLV